MSFFLFTPVVPNNLPTRCFISHSYKDRRAIKRLCAILQDKGIEPVIFPPILVSPDQMVSNELISTILECDGFIFLKGGHSAKSFWVAFERDYAIRANKKVFSFNSTDLIISEDTSKPIYLNIFAAFAAGDEARVTPLISFMRNQRFIDINSMGYTKNSFNQRGDLGEMMVNYLKPMFNSGYYIFFWSLQSSREEILDFAEGTYSRSRPVIIAALDDTPLPHGNKFPVIFLPERKDMPEQQIVDSFIVRLYWVTYNRAFAKGLFRYPTNKARRLLALPLK